MEVLFLFCFAFSILFSVLCTSWICGLVSDITLGKFSVITISDISSVFFFFFFWFYHYICVIFLIVVPWFLDILFCFLQSFFTLLFNFGGLY